MNYYRYFATKNNYCFNIWICHHFDLILKIPHHFSSLLLQFDWILLTKLDNTAEHALKIWKITKIEFFWKLKDFLLFLPVMQSRKQRNFSHKFLNILTFSYLYFLDCIVSTIQLIQNKQINTLHVIFSFLSYLVTNLHNLPKSTLS